MLALPAVALILPFALWPVEIFLPYPYLIEEIAKGILVLLMLKDIESNAQGIKLSIILGALFAISESVLYIFNIQLVGNLSTLLVRLAVTVPFHAFTSVVIFIFASSRKVSLTFLGIIVAMTLHYLFNSLIPFLRI